MRADQLEDDMTELLVMIRRRSGGANALEAPKAGDAKALPETTESTQVHETLSSGHFEP